MIVAALFLCNSIMAQQSRTITLKEAVDLTLAYNKTLKINKRKLKKLLLQ